jgi:hypothetical protein
VRPRITYLADARASCGTSYLEISIVLNDMLV